MIIEISIGVIALVFLVLLGFLIPVLKETKRTLKRVNLFLNETQKDVRNLSDVSVGLVENVNKLTIDLKRKSDDLNVVFQPLHQFRKTTHEKKSNVEKITELLEVVAQSVPLMMQIKERIKEYAKSR